MYPVCFLSLSLFLTLAVTFPSPCPYILPLCPLFLVPTSGLCYAAFFFSNFSSHGFLSLPPSLLIRCVFEMSFTAIIIGFKTCHSTSHKPAPFSSCMSVSPRMLTSLFFSLLFCDNADTVCNIMAHGGVRSHCAHIWSHVSGVKLRNSSLEQSGKAENGLDYSVTLLKRPRNVPNWLQ